MKILFLTNLLPYPLDNGGKIKTYTTIHTLANAGHEIDLVCFTEQIEFNKQDQSKMLELCNKVEQVYLKLTTAENKKYMILLAARSIFSKYSFGVYKYRSKKMEEKLGELSRECNYDCVYFDHLQMCVYRDVLLRLAPHAKFILDEHNCEAIIMSRNSELSSNLVKKVFLKLESKKLSAFESAMLEQMSVNIVLSEEDYLELRSQCGKDFIHTIIPIGVQDRGRKKERAMDGKLNILFIGTLTWEPNNQGLIWFLTNVMPLLIEAELNFRLYIVGKNPSAEVKKLATKYKNIIVTGYVESVDEYYDLCDCMIVPLFIGSGQRVKLIEGFSKGMPAVSTSIGAEGLEVKDEENIIITNTKEGFLEALIRLEDSKLRSILSDNARKTYENNYSSATIANKLNDVVGTIISNSEEQI